MSGDLNSLWLVGAGPMAVAYARVLDKLGRGYSVIGRGPASAEKFTAEVGRPVAQGGVAAFAAKSAPAAHAIVATGVGELAETTRALIAVGVRQLLVEKPGGLDRSELSQVAKDAAAKGAQVYLAYNRRYYASTRRARELIAEDGGVTSFQFEFTEWSHEIVGLPTPTPVKQAWLLANSSHVIDLAFHLGGRPTDWSSWKAGSTSWHPSGAIYAGAGKTDRGALFSYHANWEAPGRWGVEVLTRKRRYIFRPMEKLHTMKIGSVAITEEPIEDEIDKQFKPGLYRQTEQFLSGVRGELQSLEDQMKALDEYERIGG